MKVLKTILGIIYLVLIILLLLSNCRGCEHRDSAITEPVDTLVTEPEPADTASLVERAKRTGRTGDLKVTLLWNFYADIDLHVKQPNGNVIFYKMLKDEETGGFLDADNKIGGNGSAENIFWENPPKGEYEVSLVYYQHSSNPSEPKAGICSVIVFQAGKEPQTYQVEMSMVGEEKKVVTINIL